MSYRSKGFCLVSERVTLPLSQGVNWDAFATTLNVSLRPVNDDTRMCRLASYAGMQSVGQTATSATSLRSIGK